MYWLLVGLVRLLKSSHKEAMEKLLLCEDYSDLTSPTSNHILDLDIAVSVVFFFICEKYLGLYSSSVHTIWYHT